MAKNKQKRRDKSADSKPDAKRQAAAARDGADGPFPYPKNMDDRQYRRQLNALQIELLKVQRWVRESGQKIAVVFEGRDAAGKGGTIKRIREHLNPRGARVVALIKPNETELGQWYFQRYISQLPTAGEIVFFDRSWYNRAGVEPVMGFCTAEQYQRFMRQVPEVERAWVESGLWLFKFWFDVGQAEQTKRIAARQKDPLKHWKISPIDFESMKRFDAFTKARNVMLFFTDTEHAPWTVVRSDDKRRARIGAILALLNGLPYPDKDLDIVTAPDPLIVGSGEQMFPRRRRHLFDVMKDLPE